MQIYLLDLKQRNTILQAFTIKDQLHSSRNKSVVIIVTLSGHVFQIREKKGE